MPEVYQNNLKLLAEVKAYEDYDEEQPSTP
jgi:hypothetical protein